MIGFDKHCSIVVLFLFYSNLGCHAFKRNISLCEMERMPDWALQGPLTVLYCILCSFSSPNMYSVTYKPGFKGSRVQIVISSTFSWP